MAETASTAVETPSQRGRVRDYAGLVRIEHALFSLPMFISGALVAGPGHFPSWRDWLLIVVCGTAARNLALALNRLIDKKIDSANPRTQVRELPAGRLSTAQVTGFVSLNLLVYALGAWLIAPVCLYLGWIPLAVFVIYPFMKRFTPLCHLGVGAGLAMAPLGGYLAAAKSWPIAPEAWLLAAFTWLWVSGFDVIYAQLDVEFDRAHGIHSLPARFGRRALAVAMAMHAGAVGVLLALWGFYFEGRAWLWLPLAVLVLLFFLQHRHAHRVNLAAFRINTVVGFVMLTFVILGIMT